MALSFSRECVRVLGIAWNHCLSVETNTNTTSNSASLGEASTKTIVLRMADCMLSEIKMKEIERIDLSLRVSCC